MLDMDASQLESANLGRIITIILAGSCFAYITFAWIRELLFYRRHHWDFDQDIKGPNFFGGESEHPSAMMTNSDRLKKGYPFAVFLTFILLLGAIYVMGN